MLTQKEKHALSIGGFPEAVQLIEDRHNRVVAEAKEDVKNRIALLVKEAVDQALRRL